MSDVIVKKSGIHGSGVFASRDFKKGEVVIKWDISHRLTPEEVKNLPESERRYVTHVGGKYVLMRPPARYVNHSCDANTYVDYFSDIAKREIKEGEEITGDYSEDGVPGFEMKCNCRSENCRKVIKKAS